MNVEFIKINAKINCLLGGWLVGKIARVELAHIHRQRPLQQPYATASQRLNKN